MRLRRGKVGVRKLPITALALLVAMLAIPSISGIAAGSDSSKNTKNNKKSLRTVLKGFEEVPAISSTGSGEFRGEISEDESSIEFELSYQDLEAEPTVAHIHFSPKKVNGGVAAFLCGGGGKPPCPPAPATVTGTITASDIIGPANQGIDAGEFEEFLTALRSGKTYANVHSTKYPAGEIRGQIK